MQEVSDAILATTMPNNGDTMTLTDSRDNQDYTVAKINGQYWMTKNLNLAGGTKLSHTDTNVPVGYSTTTAGFTDGDTLPVSSTSGFSDNATAYVYNSGSTTCGYNSPCYSYYSYPAATAGYNPSSGSSDYDICPRGWRLPTRSELLSLRNSYNTGAKLIDNPFQGVYAGRYYGGYFHDGGVSGHYWSSTASNSDPASFLYFGTSYSGVDHSSKYNGNSIRCVKKTS